MTKTDASPSLDWLEDEPTAFHRRYWTTHCEGFRVDFPGGAHGYVEEVRHQDDPDRSAALVVRVGALGRQVVIVPVDQIEFVVPRASGSG